jgi:lysine/ornithine N-monooxygenase
MRGLLYDYDEYMLIDDSFIKRKDGTESKSNFWMDYLKELSAEFFNCEYVNYDYKRQPKENIEFIGENKKLYVGIDFNGEQPCIFVEPKTYINKVTKKQVYYKVEKEVKTAFNKLINTFEHVFMIPLNCKEAKHIKKYIKE